MWVTCMSAASTDAAQASDATNVVEHFSEEIALDS
jgi:hypothetical protein